MVAKKTRAKRRTNVDRNTELVNSAERRAKVVAYLNEIAPQEVKSKQVAEHFGWDNKTAHNTMNSLRRGGEVQTRGDGTGRGNAIMFSARGSKPAPVDVAHVDEGHQLVPVTARATRKYERKINGHGTHAPADAGVELVIGGVTAIMSRNPTTGRPRVVFEF